MIERRHVLAGAGLAGLTASVLLSGTRSSARDLADGAGLWGDLLIKANRPQF
jgi:hypothetical protein